MASVLGGSAGRPAAEGAADGSAAGAAGRVAVVTHATRYAGPGSVEALRKAGYTVLCHDESFLDEAARASFEDGRDGAVASSARTATGAVGQAVKRYGRLDLVVSNDVHPARYLPVEQADPAELRRAAEALLVTPVAVLAKAAAHMKRRGSGHIVLMTSAAPLRPEAGFSTYSSLRAGASAYARAAARELAPHGVTVHAVAPNFLESETYYPPELWETDEGRERLRDLLPAGRLGTAEEIGDLVVFLGSGSADFLTGDVLHFTGGWM
ncbi:SDR family oxidoreductase [Streptomyces sp. NPDC008121]|uniref:SDR family oxidoreductase n=1 Tax=Streptomyces sp. NPDC008121 TaxID=3364809 RepID=UPI0036E7D585